MHNFFHLKFENLLNVTIYFQNEGEFLLYKWNEILRVFLLCIVSIHINKFFLMAYNCLSIFNFSSTLEMTQIVNNSQNLVPDFSQEENKSGVSYNKTLLCIIFHL